MMISKKAIPRRTVLRGLGAALALPLFDGMVPAMTALAKTAGKPINRFGVVYVPNGMIMEHWTPKVAGALGDLPVTLSSMTPFRDQMLILSGLDCLINPTPGRPGGSHAKASTRFLTGVTPPTSETDLDAGISMDQLAARELGKQTQFASLELSIESSETAGACDVGFACPYTNTIAWKSANTPLPMQHNPRALFERMFGDSGSTDPKVRLARIQRQRSILDSVTEEVADFQRELGKSDRVKLGQYFEAIRDVERRIQMAEEQSGQELPVIDHPAGIPAVYDDHVKLMFDLEVLAYQTDLTRVVTFMFGREFSGVTYPQVGVPDAHHPVSHHQEDPEKIARVAKINAYHVKLFSYLVDKLKATPDGDGTLLDHMTMMYGAGMSDSNAHSPRNVPVMLVGGGAGTLKGGRHIQYAKDTPLGNLQLTLLDKFGVQWDRIGESTGRLDDRQLSGLA